MKISKLFHWLYAILMLLPVVVFIPTAFYYGFNEHSVAQEKTEQVPVYYESNEVNTASDLVINNIYFWRNDYHEVAGVNSKQLFYIKINSLITERFNLTGTFTALRAVLNSQGRPFIEVLNNNTYLYSINMNQKFDFVLEDYYTTNIESVIDYIEESNYKYVKEYLPLTTSMSITDSMSYAWDSVWQNDLFSWTYDSFLTEPFLYITNLFNVPANNTLVYCLSYWLNLSIIWLTFDVIMYVPLLVHRWLDKGIVE